MQTAGTVTLLPRVGEAGRGLQYSSPYVGMGNDPVNLVDPDGMTPKKGDDCSSWTGGINWQGVGHVLGAPFRAIGGLFDGLSFGMANGMGNYTNSPLPIFQPLEIGGSDNYSSFGGGGGLLGHIRHSNLSGNGAHSFFLRMGMTKAEYQNRVKIAQMIARCKGMKNKNGKLASSNNSHFNVEGTRNTLSLIGLSLLIDRSQTINLMFQQSNVNIRLASIQNNIPAKQIDEIMKRTKIVSSRLKMAGRGVIVLSSFISVYKGFDAASRGDSDGAKMAGLDLAVGLGTAAIGGVPGLALYAIYTLMMTPPKSIINVYPIPFCVPDNTYRVLPIIPELKK